MSVANIWRGNIAPLLSIVSSRQKATEYASSPVEQAGTHTRTASEGARFSSRSGNTFVCSVPNAPGSRKNDVTLIRKSWNSASSSPGFSRRWTEYDSRLSILWRAMRRRIRRIMVEDLYWAKSTPVASLTSRKIRPLSSSDSNALSCARTSAFFAT